MIKIIGNAIGFFLLLTIIAGCFWLIPASICTLSIALGSPFYAKVSYNDCFMQH